MCLPWSIVITQARSGCLSILLPAKSATTMLHKTGSNGMRLALACPSTAAAVARVAMPATSGTILPSRRSESTAAGVAGDGASGGGGGTQRKSGLISVSKHVACLVHVSRPLTLLYLLFVFSPW